MESYARALLHLVRPLAINHHAEIFAFATDLTRITLSVRRRFPADAIEQLTSVVNPRVAAKGFEPRTGGMAAGERPTDVTTDLAAPLPPSLTTFYRRCCMTRPSTRTTGSNGTTAGSRQGCDQCAACEPIGPRRRSSGATHSSRTCDAATTNSASKHATNVCVSRPRLMNSPPRSDRTSGRSTVGRDGRPAGCAVRSRR